MSTSSIFFSKNHFLNPLTLEYKDHKINENLKIDKKIQTIAISIIVGTFTLGIGAAIPVEHFSRAI
jgi:hypothetical protein